MGNYLTLIMKLCFVRQYVLSVLFHQVNLCKLCLNPIAVKYKLGKYIGDFKKYLFWGRPEYFFLDVLTSLHGFSPSALVTFGHHSSLSLAAVLCRFLASTH